MANYQELLSRAVRALPENNGASRREVYEKARKALVTQLRAIDPPLPAREITQHRLELEDCIREVEHKATEALLGDLKNMEETSIPLAPEPDPAPEKVNDENRKVGTKENTDTPVAGEEKGVDKAEKSDEKADTDNKADIKDKKPKGKDTEKSEFNDKSTTSEKAVFPEKKERAKSKASPDLEKPTDVSTKDASTKDKSTSDIDDQDTSDDDNSALDAIIARAENGGNKSELASKETRKSDLEIALEGAQGATKETENVPSRHSRPHSNKSVGAAMSRVHEVDNEPGKSRTSSVVRDGTEDVDKPVPGSRSAGKSDLVMNLAADLTSKKTGGQNDAQLSVDRAIQALDREARGEGDEDSASLVAASDFSGGLKSDETRFISDDGEEKSSNGLTIFLVLVILLLGAVGGGGYWAWKQGYIDLENLFVSGEVVEGTNTGDQSGGDSSTDVSVIDANSVIDTNNGDETSGPGNTTTNVRDVTLNNSDAVITDENKSDERLTSTTDENGTNSQDLTTTTDANVAETNTDDKSEDRLGADASVPDASLGTEGDVDPNAIIDAGAQSLLLEASADGSGGAVPFSGTVEWSRGLDELGSPTLIGQANIPARNLNVKLLIRKNSDASLPASHLMEIDFDVSETFAGGSVAGLPGILLKNEELVQGAALVGASARVVGNSFLFALSAAEQDQRTNLDLLETRKWMDLALIYASGRRAIITLEKDEAAQAMFRDVLAIWNGNEPASETLGETVTEAVEGAGDAITDVAVDLVQDAVTPDSNG